MTRDTQVTPGRFLEASTSAVTSAAPTVSTLQPSSLIAQAPAANIATSSSAVAGARPPLSASAKHQNASIRDRNRFEWMYKTVLSAVVSDLLILCVVICTFSGAQTRTLMTTCARCSKTPSAYRSRQSIAAHCAAAVRNRKRRSRRASSRFPRVNLEQAVLVQLPPTLCKKRSRSLCYVFI